uniref:Uncharacterized protein n=1 Tax=Alexandrium monilatum TaxID=311494 RepID=A0A7S4Q9L7_9DINO
MITNRHQRGVPRKKSVRPGAVGVQPDDSAGMQRKLQERWNPELRVRALEKKVEEYADRHGGMEQLLRTHDTETTDPELDILKKMVADGKQQLQKLPCEVATLEVLKGGMRDYIDYALAEVDRYGHTSVKKGPEDRFDWRSQGRANYIPSVFRSEAENFVGDRPPFNTVDTRYAKSEVSSIGWVGNQRFSVV